MVFPSRGCHTCKRRRIKCDFIRPLCGRCSKSNRSCTWDTDEDGGLPFRSENAYAQGRPRRPWKEKDKSPRSTELVVQKLPCISSALHLPLEIHALNYWVANFALDTTDVPDFGLEYSSYVVSYWKSASRDSSLHLALLALAYGVFGRARRSHMAIETAIRFFSKALTKVKAEIKDVASENVDPLLLTIMLMGSFENTMWGYNPHNPRNSSSSSDEVGSRLWSNMCHHKGASGLLRLRQLSGAPSNLPLDRAIRRQIIRILILGGKTIPDWLATLLCEEEGPMQHLDTLMLRLVNLRARSLYLFRNSSWKTSGERCGLPDPTQISPQQIAIEAQELDSALEAWSMNVPDEWMFVVKRPPTFQSVFPAEYSYQCPIHIYASHGHAAIWNRYRAVRLVVNSIHRRALTCLLQCPMQLPFTLAQQALCQDQIESLAIDLCGGVHFFFDSSSNSAGHKAHIRSNTIEYDFDQNRNHVRPRMATLLAWPLTVAVSTEGVPNAQRQWLLARMRMVAEPIGDAVLESVIEKGEFKF